MIFIGTPASADKFRDFPQLRSLRYPCALFEYHTYTEPTRKHAHVAILQSGEKHVTPST